MKQPQENRRDMPEEREELDAEKKKMKEKILRQVIQLKKHRYRRQTKTMKNMICLKSTKINRKSGKSCKRSNK